MLYYVHVHSDFEVKDVMVTSGLMLDCTNVLHSPALLGGIFHFLGREDFARALQSYKQWNVFFSAVPKLMDWQNRFGNLKHYYHVFVPQLIDYIQRQRYLAPDEWTYMNGFTFNTFDGDVILVRWGRRYLNVEFKSSDAEKRKRLETIFKETFRTTSYVKPPFVCLLHGAPRSNSQSLTWLKWLKQALLFLPLPSACSLPCFDHVIQPNRWSEFQRFCNEMLPAHITIRSLQNPVMVSDSPWIRFGREENLFYE